ncbi:DUF6934 family protein [Flavobacterium pectinovorum]|uniref:Uncharacterized protein n=1 Tax=Flavobacterium pectinovorum TaxID=29533 RepID=A0AB36P0D1_9FLAO|nr:hypothetical protein [Flavobacterium pectinovorum]OXB04419.1 hypothetical protein B0A72_13060 [Flavobacterium pectinovorum]SHL57742.1 hypothetical protein SAMN05444387_0964 [Flavobacterium pectinovorum]
MNYPKYDFISSTENMTFEFISSGNNGNIEKTIRYQCINEEIKIYNLTFGDNKGMNKETGELNIDDITVSNNGDLEKILATIASSVNIFSETYPDRLIFFKGSTPARTRLYRRAICKEFNYISKTFAIFGAVNIDGKIINVPFNTTDDFYGFYIKAKCNEEN